jgi:ubiquitin carboxyl-terminal hydrolase 25/28
MALLTDMQKTYQRGFRMIEREGERMAGMNPSHPAAVLNVLQTYLTHALQQSTGDRKRIVAKNKRFLMTFGDDCQALLEYLGFTYRTETLEVDGIRDEQAFWLLPEVAPKDSVEQKTNRQFLEDVICEVQQRLIERPRQEREESKVEFTWAQQSAIKDIRTALGCFGFPLDSRPITLDGDEHPHYASLGAVGTFADELIVFAYERQRECDPNNAPYYLECLKGIGDGRHSEIITEEYVKRLSMGEPTLTEVEAAYKFFALNPNQLGPHSDDHIIGVYKSYIDAAPKQKQDAKAALLKIGKARESNEIIEVAEDKEMSYKEALEFLGVVEDTPSDSIEAQAVALGLDDDKGRVAKALAIIGDHRGDFGLQMAAANMDGDASGPRLTLSEAYKRLQIHDENIADEAVFAYYQTLCAEGGAGSKDSYKDALRVIAKARNSQLLFAKMADANAVIQAPKSASDQPVGLENIGNTCYLNSLLQYYYTVKAVRDVVMNFDDYRMPLNTENILRKRVGGRSITKGEIVKSQKCKHFLQSSHRRRANYYSCRGAPLPL